MTINQSQLNEFMNIWEDLFIVPCPEERQWKVWGFLHDCETINYGLKELAGKYQWLKGQMTQEWMIRFMSAVMNNKNRKDKEKK